MVHVPGVQQLWPDAGRGAGSGLHAGLFIALFRGEEEGEGAPGGDRRRIHEHGLVIRQVCGRRRARALRGAEARR